MWEEAACVGACLYDGDAAFSLLIEFLVGTSRLRKRLRILLRKDVVGWSDEAVMVGCLEWDCIEQLATRKKVRSTRFSIGRLKVNQDR